MEIEASPEVLPAAVWHKGLQPLVRECQAAWDRENAGAGLIAIRAVRVDEQLQISVSDTTAPACLRTELEATVSGWLTPASA